jgi:hypothetical protein
LIGSHPRRAGAAPHVARGIPRRERSIISFIFTSNEPLTAAGHAPLEDSREMPCSSA